MDTRFVKRPIAKGVIACVTIPGSLTGVGLILGAVRATDGPLPDADAEHQDHLFRIRKDGYTILRGCWDAGTCSAARARLDEMHRELEPDAEPGSAFSAAHLYNKGEVFEGVYQDARLLRIVRHFLGDDATIMSLGDNAINGVITPPHPDTSRRRGPGARLARDGEIFRHRTRYRAE